MNKAVFLIIILLTFNLQIIGILGATDEGYGEDQTALGQFVDSFENLNNVSVTYQVERNSTLNAMELNYTSGTKYGSFDQFLEIYVSSSRINEVLTDFPILILLNGSAGINDFNSSIVFDEVGNSYQKIAITNGIFADERYVEVEYWNASERIAWIWTHGTFNNVSDVLLLLHYDVDVANNTAFVDVAGSLVASNVWNSKYIAVWHLSEENEPYLDSTANNNDAWEIGNIIWIERMIDGCQDILGTDDGITVNLNIGGLDSLTMEFWVDLDILIGDRAIASNWYGGAANRNFLFYFDLAPATRWRFIIDNTAGVPSVEFGSVPPLINIPYHVVGLFERNDFVYGYQNAVETIGMATANSPIKASNVNITIGLDGLARDFNGQIDDIRFSNVSRSQNWINATRFSSLDDFVTQSLGIAGPAYVSDGYFTTDDYMNDTLCNGTSLVLMVNTSIPGNTDIQVQFSNDNETWGDWEGIPLDSNILIGGFESIDLRYLNETDVYLRFNLSTTDYLLTPRIYQSRLISTIGNATAGAIAGPSGSGGIGFMMLILICSPIIILLVWRTRKR